VPLEHGQEPLSINQRRRDQLRVRLLRLHARHRA
jgi:hypothetical protein